jgi:hypothetical protein
VARQQGVELPGGQGSVEIARLVGDAVGRQEHVQFVVGAGAGGQQFPLADPLQEGG